MSEQAENKEVSIPIMQIQEVQLRIVGDSPLICHRWSEKAKKEILDKQMKKAKGAKRSKDPWADFCESLYWIDGMPKKPSEKDVAAARFARRES
jgi:hypothetical protein